MRAALPAGLRDVQHRVRSSQAQWFFDDPRIHFEAWWHANTGRLEIGLHLEAAPATNERIAQRLAQRLLEVKARLGPYIDLELWDRGWVRFYETHPVEVFDAKRVTVTAARVADVIAVLWPICREAASRAGSRPHARVRTGGGTGR